MKLFAACLFMVSILGFQSTTDWVDSDLYPFTHRSVELPAGNMHYIDEGTGETILFVHGTPTWSFLYRNQVKELSKSYRCIAPDHLGFGLSDKPENFDGTPQSHAANLEQFIEKLGLENITLVVHDFGGPIGLSYATKHPENVSRVVVLNTWLWETKNDKQVQKIDKLLHSKTGRYLYLKKNFSPKVLLKKAFHNKRALTKSIHHHYIAPFPTADSRMSLLNIGQSLLGSSDWYQTQWDQLSALDNIPLLLIWGKEDPFISTDYLDRWSQRFPSAKVILLESGHFVQEEQPEMLNETLGEFMRNSKKRLR